MRIAHFSSTLVSPLGGAEQYCVELAKWQQRKGNDCSVYAGWISDDVRLDLETVGIRVVRLAVKRPYPANTKGRVLSERVQFHAKDLLGSFRPTSAMWESDIFSHEVVHVHRFQGFGSGILAHKIVVHTVHDYSLIDTSATSMRQEKPLENLPFVQRIRARVSNVSIRHAKALIFPSQRTLDRHIALGLRIPEGIGHVIPHGWPIETLEKQLRGRGTAEGKVVFLFMGKLTRSKGVHNLLEAWAAGLRGAELWIGGAGDMDSECASLDGRFGIRYLGWLDKASRAEALAKADVLVVPSTWPENFPLVVAESLLAKMPVITTETASPPLVIDGISGLVVKDSATALRKAMERLNSDNALRVSLSKGAEQMAKELDFDVHGRKMMELYRSTVYSND